MGSPCSPCFICPFGSASCYYMPCPPNCDHPCIPANPVPRCPPPCPPPCVPSFPSCPALCPPPCPKPSEPCPPPKCPKCCPKPSKPEISFVSYPVCPSPSCPPPRVSACPSNRIVCFSSCQPPKNNTSSSASMIELKPCKSFEFIGSKFIVGCDCRKHNGLQDSCKRTECRGTPLCRARQWACCRPSGYSGGKHLEGKLKEKEC